MAVNFLFDYLVLGFVRRKIEEELKDINILLPQLTNTPRIVGVAELNEILSQSGVYIFVARTLKGKIVGMATLAIRSLLLNKTAIIGDVVVDEKYRGMKLGKKMMENLINMAKLENVSFVSLTSHPRRKEANLLYQSLGFELIGKVGESNYYRLSL